MILYEPTIRENPKVVNVATAWQGIDTILKDIIVRFNLKTDSALEFGVGDGFSTSALANYFKKVIGVDTFRNDILDLNPNRPDEYYKVRDILKGYPVELIQCRFEDFIKIHEARYDLIHIDIIHEYEPTFRCGEWALDHSGCVIFHDTISYPAVFQVCEDLSKKFEKEFYNYPECYGLGIIV